MSLDGLMGYQTSSVLRPPLLEKGEGWGEVIEAFRPSLFAVRRAGYNQDLSPDRGGKRRRVKGNG